jgi:Zn-dependent protease with chaperone function
MVLGLRAIVPGEAAAAPEAIDQGRGSGSDLDRELRPVPVPVPEPSATAVEYHRTGNWLWAGRQVWTIGVQALLLATGLSAGLRTTARRIGRIGFFTIGAYWVLYSVTVFLLELPLAYYLGFVRQHAYGLSRQTLGRWSGNMLKGLGVDLVGGFLLLWAPYWLLARSPRRWWLYTTLLSVPLLFFVTLITPIWIAPLFNRFGPLEDRALERRIVALAERAGIAGSQVYEVDMSRDTRALNAYVTGFLGTRRIVLYDTLLDGLDQEEVLAVLGHEMGHYVLGHITRSILLAPLVILLALLVVDRAGRGLARRFAPRFGFDDLADVASVPLLALLLQLAALGLSPAVLAYSRAQEHEADVFALELTRANHAAGTAWVKLQQENLSVPWHTWFETFWLSTHPSIGERITFGNAYHPWAEGRPLRYGGYFH